MDGKEKEEEEGKMVSEEDYEEEGEDEEEVKENHGEGEQVESPNLIGRLIMMQRINSEILTYHDVVSMNN